MDNHNNNNILKGFTKQEIINYLDIKDRLIDVKNNKIIPENKLTYTDIMMYALPFILVLIAILVIYIVYKNRRNNTNDDNDSKCK
jgi:cytochrome c-type biogenesis protein CcmH/NrfF|tara:strand:+ start:4848 stop:5102 length:255 start_codon:yes stop_codon:yes gene_type:complete